jgi:hypothetical protein
MPFDIDEEKIKAIHKPDSEFKKSLLRFDDSISEFFSKVYFYLRLLIIVVIVLGLIIFIGGSIIGFLKFGWNQL